MVQIIHHRDFQEDRVEGNKGVSFGVGRHLAVGEMAVVVEEVMVSVGVVEVMVGEVGEVEVGVVQMLEVAITSNRQHLRRCLRQPLQYRVYQAQQGLERKLGSDKYQ